MQLSNRPEMVRYASRHRRGHSQRPMNPHEIVMRVVERDRFLETCRNGSESGEIELQPATIESETGTATQKLKPDEKVTITEYGVAELGTAPYKVIKETHSFDDPRRAEVVSWKFVPIPQPAKPSP
jgi:hypothetical protein